MLLSCEACDHAEHAKLHWQTHILQLGAGDLSSGFENTSTCMHMAVWRLHSRYMSLLAALTNLLRTVSAVSADVAAGSNLNCVSRLAFQYRCTYVAIDAPYAKPKPRKLDLSPPTPDAQCGCDPRCWTPTFHWPDPRCTSRIWYGRDPQSPQA